MPQRAPQSNEGGWGAIVVIGGLAFLLGRCSVDSPPPDAAFDGNDYALADVEANAEAIGEADDEVAVEAYTPQPLYQPPPESTVPTYFANCSAARAAGAAPVYSGDPGYASHLDRDNDGVGCE